MYLIRTTTPYRSQHISTSPHTPHPWPHITTALHDRDPTRRDHPPRTHRTPPAHGVLAIPNPAIRGPVSASRSSNFADESALTLDEIDHAFLDNATAVWQIGRPIPLPDIGSQRHAAPEFLPTHHANVPAAHHRTHLVCRRRTRARSPHPPGRSTAGTATTYPLERLHLHTPEDRDRFRRGDVLIPVTADKARTHRWPSYIQTRFQYRTPATRSPTSYTPGPISIPCRCPTPKEHSLTSDTPTPRLRTAHRVLSPPAGRVPMPVGTLSRAATSARETSAANERPPRPMSATP